MSCDCAAGAVKKAEVVAVVVFSFHVPHHQLHAIQNDSGATFVTEKGATNSTAG